jgi:hypothetical protein
VGDRPHDLYRGGLGGFWVGVRGIGHYSGGVLER